MALRKRTQPKDKPLGAPDKKRCSECKEVKWWHQFYIVPSYPDKLSHCCVACSSRVCRRNQHKRQLKKLGRATFAERIAHLRRIADAMEKVLREEA